jgi:LPPG:FO 2-phospho-L-lactate transferase
VTVIANTGDDITLFGLRVSPDVDTLLYTLGNGVHEGQGWGRADETPPRAGRARGLRRAAAVVRPG